MFEFYLLYFYLPKSQQDCININKSFALDSMNFFFFYFCKSFIYVGNYVYI